MALVAAAGGAGGPALPAGLIDVQNEHLRAIPDEMAFFARMDSMGPPDLSRLKKDFRKADTDHGRFLGLLVKSRIDYASIVEKMGAELPSEGDAERGYSALDVVEALVGPRSSNPDEALSFNQNYRTLTSRSKKAGEDFSVMLIRMYEETYMNFISRVGRGPEFGKIFETCISGRERGVKGIKEAFQYGEENDLFGSVTELWICNAGDLLEEDTGPLPIHFIPKEIKSLRRLTSLEVMTSREDSRRFHARRLGSKLYPPDTLYTVPDLSNLERLRKIKLPGLVTVPNSLGSAKVLIELKIKKIASSRFPRSLQRLDQLKRLEVDKGEPSLDFPEVLCCLRSLEHLTLREGFELKSLRNSLFNLKHLEHLELSVGRLKDSSLRTLWLANGLPNLQKIVLQTNRLNSSGRTVEAFESALPGFVQKKRPGEVLYTRVRPERGVQRKERGPLDYLRGSFRKLLLSDTGAHQGFKVGDNVYDLGHALINLIRFGRDNSIPKGTLEEVAFMLLDHLEQSGQNEPLPKLADLRFRLSISKLDTLPDRFMADEGRCDPEIDLLRRAEELLEDWEISK